MLRLLLFVSCLLPNLAFLNLQAHAAEERVFEGPWNNRRTGASGTMTCNASEVATRSVESDLSRGLSGSAV